jgi:hypothetical protein
MPRSFLRYALLGGLCACVVPPAGDAPTARIGGGAPGAPLDLMAGGGDDCGGQIVSEGGQSFLALEDGTRLAMAPMTVRVDGAKKAFHPDNAEGGAILHRCNAGEVVLPGGERYEGAASNAVCLGKFEEDAARIEAAGHEDGGVGAIRWHRIAATGSAKVGGRLVPRTTPLLQADGSGFYVSQTALQDERFGVTDPARYVDAAEVPYAAVRRDQKIPLGSFGVAYRVRGCSGARECRPVPFVVADLAPKAGEGSIALARAVSDLPNEDVTQRNRFYGEVRGPDVLTVYFADRKAAPPYDAKNVGAQARAAFAEWGGQDRLGRCLRRYLPELDGEAER